MNSTSTIAGTTVAEANSWWAGPLYGNEGGEERSTVLGILIDGRPSRAERDRAAQEREQHRREADAEREKQRLQFVKSQPKDAVSHSAIHGGEAMTLAAAHALLQSYGGTVVPRGDQTLAFALPRQLSADALTDQAYRARAHEAIRVLDSWVCAWSCVPVLGGRAGRADPSRPAMGSRSS